MKKLLFLLFVLILTVLTTNSQVALNQNEDSIEDHNETVHLLSKQNEDDGGAEYRRKTAELERQTNQQIQQIQKQAEEEARKKVNEIEKQQQKENQKILTDAQKEAAEIIKVADKYKQDLERQTREIIIEEKKEVAKLEKEAKEATETEKKQEKHIKEAEETGTKTLQSSNALVDKEIEQLEKIIKDGEKKLPDTEKPFVQPTYEEKQSVRYQIKKVQDKIDAQIPDVKKLRDNMDLTKSPSGSQNKEMDDDEDEDGNVLADVTNFEIAQVKEQFKNNCRQNRAFDLFSGDAVVKISNCKGEGDKFSATVKSQFTEASYAIQDNSSKNINIPTATISFTAEEVVIEGKAKEGVVKMGLRDLIHISNPEYVLTYKNGETPKVLVQGVGEFWKFPKLHIFMTTQGTTVVGVFRFSKETKWFKPSDVLPVLKEIPIFPDGFFNVMAPEIHYSNANTPDNLPAGTIIRGGRKIEFTGMFKFFKYIFKTDSLEVQQYLILRFLRPADLQGIQAGFDLPLPEVTVWRLSVLRPYRVLFGLNPKNPSVQLSLVIGFKIPVDETLLKVQFYGKFSTQDFVGGGETITPWKDPFGVKGITIEKIIIEIGFDYKILAATGLPSRVGLIGYFNFPGVGAVKTSLMVDAGQKQYILHGAIEKFGVHSLIDLVNSMGAKFPKNAIPNIIEFQNIEVSISPTGGNIGTVEFDNGFTMRGELLLMNQKFASVYVRVYPQNFFLDYAVYVNATAKAIKLGPLQIKETDLQVRIGAKKFLIVIKGGIVLNVVFEFKRVIDVLIDEQKIKAKLETTIYTLELTAKREGLKALDFVISGYLNPDFINKIVELVQKGINAVGTAINKGTEAVSKFLKSDILKKATTIPKIKVPSFCSKKGNSLEYDPEKDDHSWDKEIVNENASEHEKTLTYGYYDLEDFIAEDQDDEDILSVDDEVNVLIFGRAKRFFRRAARTVSRGASRAARTVARGASRAARTVARGASRAFSAAKDGYDKAKRGVTRAVNSAKDKASHYVKNQVDKAKEKFKKLGNSIKNEAIGIKNKAKDLANKTKDFAKKAYDKTKDLAKKAIEKAKKLTCKAVSGAINGINKATSGLNSVVKKAREGLAKLSDMAKIPEIKIPFRLVEARISAGASLTGTKAAGFVEFVFKCKVGGKDKSFKIKVYAASNAHYMAAQLIKNGLEKVGGALKRF